MSASKQVRLKRANVLFQSGDFTDQEIAGELGVTRNTVLNYKRELGYTGVKPSEPRGILNNLSKALAGVASGFFAYEITQDEDFIQDIGDKIKKGFRDNPEISMLIATSPMIWRQKVKPFLQDDKNQTLVDNLEKVFPYAKLLFTPGVFAFIILWLGRKIHSALQQGFDWVKPFFSNFIKVLKALVEGLGAIVPDLDDPTTFEGPITGKTPREKAEFAFGLLSNDQEAIGELAGLISVVLP